MKKQILITALIVINLVLLSGCFGNEGESSTSGQTVSYTQLCDDADVNMETTFSFKSYKPDDIIYIKDKILEYKYYENGSMSVITFDCDHHVYRQLPILIYQDKRGEYYDGMTVTIPVHVREYTVDGKDVIWLEEWHNYYKTGFAPPQ